MIAQLCKCSKNHWIVHFEKVTFMVYKLYLNTAVKKLPQILNVHIWQINAFTTLTHNFNTNV